MKSTNNKKKLRYTANNKTFTQIYMIHKQCVNRASTGKQRIDILYLREILDNIDDREKPLELKSIHCAHFQTLGSNSYLI